MTGPDLQALDVVRTRRVLLRYLEYAPVGERPPDGWPLVLFLHGAGEKGDDPERVRQTALPQLIEGGLCIPAIIVCPQCPPGLSWPVEDLDALLEALSRRDDVDHRRLHLTGVSMGARGVWDLAYRRAGEIASIAPIAGLGVPNLAPNLSELPAWIVHGAEDAIVPVERSAEMADALAAAGADVRYSPLPGEGHECGRAAYGDPELWRWMFSKRRGAASTIKSWSEQHG